MTRTPIHSVALTTIFASSLAACATTIRTAAEIFRFEAQDSGVLRFRRCVVHLGWTESDLYARCGVPIRRVASVYRAERCLVYKSVAHSLAVTNAGAPYYVVCTRPGVLVNTSKKEVGSEEGAGLEGPWRVYSVSGVSEVPFGPDDGAPR